jgi:hypothetical protein
MHNVFPPAPSIPTNDDIAEAAPQGRWFISRCHQLFETADNALKYGHLRGTDAVRLRTARQDLEIAMERVPLLLKLAAFALLPPTELEGWILLVMAAEGTIRNLATSVTLSEGQKIANREAKVRKAQERNKSKGAELRDAVRDALSQPPKWRDNLSDRSVASKILGDVCKAVGRPVKLDTVYRHVKALREALDSNSPGSDL